MKSNEELLKELKLNIAVSKFEDEQNRNHQNTPNNKKIFWRYFMKKKIVAISLISFIMVSSVVFGFNSEKIKKYYRGLGKGIDTAVQNGYIAENEMEYVKSNSQITDENKGKTLENIEVSAKVDDFLMDDLNISTHFILEIDTAINENINLDDLHSVELTDLLVSDENNNILFCMNKEKFEKYCIENNLDYEFNNFNEHYYNCGVNSFIESKYKENGIINLVYNMYTGDKIFPRSKKLKFQFSRIILKRNDYLENEDSILNIKGNWTMELDVPEEMYNRQNISYRVVSCEEPDFEITNAILTNTGFELGIIISNMVEPTQRPQILEDLWQQYLDGIIDINEYNRIINYEEIYKEAVKEDLKARNPITKEDLKFSEEKSRYVGEAVTYIENEKGEKFKCSTSPSRRQDNNFIEGNKFSFYETFELTKYDATDKLKVRVVYKDKPVIIELERIN